MRLSRRVMHMQESSIRSLAPLAEQAKAKGRRVYHLNIGQPDIPTPEAFFQGVRDFCQPVVCYTPSEGLPQLRQVFSDYYQGHHIPLSPEEIVVTCGGSEALLFAMIMAADPGDEILVPEPLYASYVLVAAETDLRLVPVPTTMDQGFHLPEREELEKRIGPRTRAMLFTSPGNPTGTVYTREEMQMAARLAQDYDLAIISDEVYREFVYQGEHVSFLHFPEISQRVFLVDSISKRYSACGARVGCLASKMPGFREQAIKMAQARLSVALLEQQGAISLAQTPASYFDEVREEYRRRRDLTVRLLKQMPGVQCFTPEGAFYLLATLPVEDSQEFASWLLRDFSHQEATVMVAPADGFYVTPGLGRDQVRIAYVLKEPELEAALEALAAGLAQFSQQVSVRD